MNNKYLKAVDGMPNGSEILRKLAIKDSDPFDKAKLAAIENTVKAIKDGASLEDAVKNAWAIANKKKTSSSALANIEMPDDVAEGIEQVVVQVALDDLSEMPAQIAEHTDNAAASVENSLGGMVQGLYYQTVAKTIKDPAFKDEVIAAIKKRRQSSAEN